ncbi:MAG: hypothetical protein R2867_31945 [Caldilineaceae bacterium]
MTTKEAWQLHDNAPELYERYLVPTLFTPWAHDLLAAAALQPGSGCSMWPAAPAASRA